MSVVNEIRRLTQVQPENVNKRPGRTLRNTLIEPFKQVKLGLYVMVITILFIGVFGFLYASAFYAQYQHVMEIFNIVDAKSQMELVDNSVFRANAIRILIAFVTFLVVLFAVIFRTTHRYYGPLVSIERFVTQVTAGDYSQRVNIRKGDELGRLVSLLNDMAVQLEQRHGPSKKKRASDHLPNEFSS